MKEFDVKNKNVKQANIVEAGNNAAGNNYIDNRQKRTTIIKPQVSETKYKEPETYRPSLRDREDDIVSGVGYIIDRYDDKKMTVINLIDNDGYYMADHTQLDMKERIFDYEIDLGKTRFVEFTGKVNKYKRSNKTIDYSIDLHHKPLLFDGRWYNCNIDYSILDNGFNEQKINNFLSKASTRELEDLIMKISNELNIITKFEFNNNFIFDFIVNTFFLNRATYDLYEGNIRGLQCSNYALADLLYIISNVLFTFKTLNLVILDNLLADISYSCNIIQHVSSYNQGNDLDFKKYCKRHLNIETNKQLANAWNTMLNRKRNFGKQVNPNNIKLNDILNNAFHIINLYI